MFTEILNAILGKHIEYDVTPGVPIGENWISSVFRVNILKPKILHLFVKCIPTSKARKLALQSEVFFQNEVQFYKKVLPEFMKFQEEKRIEEPFDSVPTVFYISNEMIVMEDLKSFGYVMKNKRLPLDLSHVSLLLREIGRFHAISFAFKDQCPERFSEIKSFISETVFKSNESGKFVNILTSAWNAALKVARKNFCGDDLTLIETFFDSVLDKMFKLSTPDEPYSVILHGDLHTNNIMFHYRNEHNTEHPDKLCLLDFQMARYTSPALDVSFILMLGVSKVTRQKNRDQLLRIYHDSLGEHLKVLGSDPDQLFPFSALEQQMKLYTVFGLAMSLVAIPGTIGEEETSVNLENLCDSSEDLNTVICSSFDNLGIKSQQIIVDLLKEAVENGYFNSQILM